MGLVSSPLDTVSVGITWCSLSDGVILLPVHPFYFQDGIVSDFFSFFALGIRMKLLLILSVIM